MTAATLDHTVAASLANTATCTSPARRAALETVKPDHVLTLRELHNWRYGDIPITRDAADLWAEDDDDRALATTLLRGAWMSHALHPGVSNTSPTNTYIMVAAASAWIFATRDAQLLAGIMADPETQSPIREFAAQAYSALGVDADEPITGLLDACDAEPDRPAKIELLGKVTTIMRYCPVTGPVTDRYATIVAGAHPGTRELSGYTEQRWVWNITGLSIQPYSDDIFATLLGYPPSFIARALEISENPNASTAILDMILKRIITTSLPKGGHRKATTVVEKVIRHRNFDASAAAAYLGKEKRGKVLYAVSSAAWSLVGGHGSQSTPRPIEGYLLLLIARGDAYVATRIRRDYSFEDLKAMSDSEDSTSRLFASLAMTAVAMHEAA